MFERRTYADEYFRKAVMLPADRKGGLEVILFSVFSIGVFLLFLAGKGIYELIKMWIEHAKESEKRRKFLEKFKNDIKLTNYVIFYKLIEGSLNNSYEELSQKVNFIAYDSDKEDLCVSDQRLQQVMKYLDYDLRLVKGKYLREDHRRYVFVTDTEMKHMAKLLSNEFGVEVGFKGYS